MVITVTREVLAGYTTTIHTCSLCGARRQWEDGEPPPHVCPTIFEAGMRPQARETASAWTARLQATWPGVKGVIFVSSMPAHPGLDAPITYKARAEILGQDGGCVWQSPAPMAWAQS